LLVLCLAAGTAGATQVRLEQAARASARELARGEGQASAVETARRLAGAGVDVSIGADHGYARVRVSTAALLPWLTGPGWLVLSAEAEARSEEAGTVSLRPDGR
jgi:hypothetical protein